MATSAILVMVLAITPAVASSKEGHYSSTGGTSLSVPQIGTGGTTVEKQVQIASEISQSREKVPDGYNLINETIMGGYYIAWYITTEVETSREKAAPGGSFLLRFHFVDDYHVVVHRLGSNETIIYDPMVWELSKEYGKG